MVFERKREGDLMPMMPPSLAVPNEKPIHRWVVLGWVAAFWFIFGLALFLGGNVSRMAPPSWQRTAYGLLVSIGTFVVTLMFLRREGRTTDSVGFAPDRRSPLRMGLGFAIGLAIVAAVYAILALVGVRWTRMPEVGVGAIAANTVMFFALACMEELGFRGYPLRRLAESFGLWGGQSIVAAMFVLYHVLQGWPPVAALIGPGLGSLLYGMAAVTSRGLALPIGVHAAWNIADWALGGKGEFGPWKMAVSDDFRRRAQLTGTIAYGVMTLIAIAAFWAWHRRRRP
jgi:hypothetical protein